MSGGPPHHPRQNPSGNTAWNHLQVPNYFPSRQPQHAHMSNEHPHMHQPTWHTPTTEPMKAIPPSHLYNLEQMLNERQYPRHSPGVDLSLTRNGSQSNGDTPNAPISLSVRDANKINSLSVSAIDLQSNEIAKGLKSMSPGLKSVSPGLKSLSPGLKSVSPGLKSVSPGLKSMSPGLKSVSPGLNAMNAQLNALSAGLNMMNQGLNPALAGINPGLTITPGLKSISPGLKAMSPGISTSPGLLEKPHGSPKNTKRANIRVDSFLERLNPTERLHSAQSAALAQMGLLGMEKLPSALEKLPITVEKVMSTDKSHGNEKFPTGLPIHPALLLHHDKVAAELLQEKVSGLLQEKLGSIYQQHEKQGMNPFPQVDDRLLIEKLSMVPPVEKTQPTDASKLDSMLFNLNQSELKSTQHSSSHDENSNSSSAPPNIPVTREDDFSSAYSNDDSLDNSGKSRRKRKPSKTVRVAKEDKISESAQAAVLETIPEVAPPQRQELPAVTGDSTKADTDSVETQNTLAPVEAPVTVEDRLPTNENLGEILEGNKIPERRRSRSTEPLDEIIPMKTRRKTSSESETIANIAAMVQEGLTQDASSTPSPLSNTNEPTMENAVDEQLTLDKPAENPETEKSSNISINQPSLSTPVVQTAAQRKATNFVEVENKLEEMFAGIEEGLMETEPEPNQPDEFISDSVTENKDNEMFSVASSSQNQDVTSTSAEMTPKKATPGKKTPGKRGRAKSDPDSPKKKKNGKKGKGKTPAKLAMAKTPTSTSKKGKKLNGKPQNTKVELVKDIYAYDSGSNTSSSRSRGPFVHIKGPRDSPISVAVVNTPVNDDDTEKKPPKTKKFHDDTEYRHKVRSKGLHCSTLSNKYDAQTKDVSWICSFCKLGPHCPSIAVSGFPQGDLFGPYIITTASSEYEKCLVDPYDAQFKSRKAARAADMVMAPKSSSSKKSKRKHSESEHDVMLGITETVDKNYEVWVHEDCIVWSPGVYLVGPKIVGLEDAVWTACNVKCSLCNFKGANVCCLRRGCANVAHISCARTGAWVLDGALYKAYCPEHKPL